MRGPMIVLLAAGAALAGCAADPNAFYPETARGERMLEQRALAEVPPNYEPTSVTIVREWGRPFGGAGFGAAWSGLAVGSDLGNTEVVGYDAWVRVQGCKGYYLVRFNRWGRLLTTGDMTEC
ncbi:MAG TPA: hypothetical protein VIR38_11135 [Thalassobaculum sp.]